MSDEKLTGMPGVGRPVGFIGGPNAGQARMIPEGAGDVVKGENGYTYRIWPFRASVGKNVMYLAFEDGRDPLEMMLVMWGEYSVSAQIRGGDHGFMKRMGKDIDSRT